jgi:hypothetical protein
VYSSSSIGTVRADEEGRFTYILPIDLIEEGTHDVYVASVNGAGTILAKSVPVSFEKKAEDIYFAVPSSTSTPSISENPWSFERMVTFSALLLFFITFGGIVWTGRHQVHLDDGEEWCP